MATDKRKHLAPAAGETPKRQSINDLSHSINDIVPVANTTERAQLVADLTALGTQFAPSATKPLYVHRQDAGTGRNLEVTIDGTTWRTVPSYGGTRTNVFSLPGTLTTETSAGTPTSYTTILAGTITAAPAGDYQVFWRVGMRAAAGVGGYARLTAGGTVVDETRADLEAALNRFYSGVALFSHAGGNLVLNLDVRATQPVTVLGSATTTIKAVAR